VGGGEPRLGWRGALCGGVGARGGWARRGEGGGGGGGGGEEEEEEEEERGVVRMRTVAISRQTTAGAFNCCTHPSFQKLLASGCALRAHKHFLGKRRCSSLAELNNTSVTVHAVNSRAGRGPPQGHPRRACPPPPWRRSQCRAPAPARPCQPLFGSYSQANCGLEASTMIAPRRAIQSAAYSSY